MSRTATTLFRPGTNRLQGQLGQRRQTRAGNAPAPAIKACPLAETGPIDLQFLERFTLGDAGLRHELLVSFIDHAPKLLAAACKAHPVDAWARAMHGLKGSARSIGASELGELAAQAEAAAVQVRTDSECRDAHLQQLRAGLAEVVAQTNALKPT